MKVKAKVIVIRYDNGCPSCPHCRINHIGVGRCKAMKGKRLDMPPDVFIPNWCPLPDKEEI
jgi:hypothetical protein